MSISDIFSSLPNGCLLQAPLGPSPRDGCLVAPSFRACGWSSAESGLPVLEERPAELTFSVKWGLCPGSSGWES